MLADALLPLPDDWETTCALAVWVPSAVAATLTLTVQTCEAERVPKTVMDPLPGVAVTVSPGHGFETPAGFATTNPDVRLRLGLNSTSIGTGFGFVIVKLSGMVPFNGMVIPFPNVIVSVGGGSVTMRLAVAVELGRA